MDAPDSLQRLAEVHGVATRYVDARRTVRVASTATLLGVLEGLGVHTGDAVRARRAALHRHWAMLVEPVTVAWEGHGAVLLRVEEAASRARITIEVALEGGGARGATRRVAGGELVERGDVGGRNHLAVGVALPGPLPWGYHRARVTVAARGEVRTGETLVVSAPRRTQRAAAGRAFGVFAPLYALHSRSSDGVGDLGDLRRLARWARAEGASTVATLPLLAAFLDGPIEISPYLPVSRRAWNELYLDLESIPDWGECDEARAVVASPPARAERRRLRSGPLVDPAAAYAWRRPALRALARHAFAEPARRAAIERFERERPEIADYARFRGAVARLGPSWYEWPVRPRSGRLREGDYDREDYRAHLYWQLCLHEQLGALRRAPELALGPYLDLPLGVHRAGYDTWREPASFALALSTGVPPDRFFEGGQDWGFPPPHPQAARAAGHPHFIAALRNHMRYAGILRIDHVMALHRLYVLPRGAAADEGTYVRQPAEELWAIVALESRRAGTVVVGENLGTVPPEVEAALRRHGAGGLHVLQMEVTPRGREPVKPALRRDVASLNTHDMATFAGWRRGHDIHTMEALGHFDEARAALERARRRREVAAIGRLPAPTSAADASPTTRALHWLSESKARLVIVGLDDLLGTLEPHNVPGTTTERPNWRRRVGRSLEAIGAARAVAAGVQTVRASRERP